MGLYYSKRHPHTRRQGKINAEGLTDSKICPSCGHEAQITEKYQDRAVYVCKNCNSINTFTRPPTDFEKTRGVRPKKEPSPPIIVRDKSKKDPEKIEKPKPEKEPEPQSENLEGFSAIQKGMDECKRIIVDYKDRHGNKTNRTIEPYKIMRDSSGKIILYAYCMEQKGIRKFTISSIRNVELLNDQFMPRWAIENKLDD